MKKEYISSRQGINTMILFIIGTSLIVGSATKAGQDAWIANILGMIFAIPILFIYARVLSLFPEKDLFEIVQIVFGNIIGKLISILFVFYAFHLAALIQRNLSEFIHVSAMPETPELVFVITMGLVCIWGVKAGIEVLARWAEFAVPMIIVATLIIIALSITKIDFNYILPILSVDLNVVLKESFSVFSFPFAETVIFMMIGYTFKNKDSKYNIYFTSWLVGGITIVAVTLRNYLVMGQEFVESTFFPTYTAVGLINIGEFLQRFEVIVALVFLCGVFIKGSICLLAACKGFANIMNVRDYRDFVAPIGLLMIYFSLILFQSFLEMQYWAFNIDKFFAFPFQVILPIIIWIGAEIKIKKIKV